MKKGESVVSRVVKAREADINDTQVISSLLAEFREEDVDSGKIRTQISAFVNDPNRAIIVVDDQDVSGMAVVNLVFKLPKVEARIDEVFVSHAARGKGYGDMLVEACEQWAWSHDADSIELTSRPAREAANALYQKRKYQLRNTNVYNKKKEV